MKRNTILLVVTTLAAWASSPLAGPSVPQIINLQGRFTDGAGNNVADGVYTVTFRIYNDPVAGSELWAERLPVQVTGGLFTTLVGNSEAIPQDLFSSGANRYLGVTVESEPEMPRIPLNSVAYAYQAQDARAATLAQNLICAGCVSAGEIAADAVGPNEIATDAVGSDEIAPESVGSAEIGIGAVGSAEIDFAAVGTHEVADGSLFAADIADEPGVASNTEGVATIAMDATIKTLLSQTIIAPMAGYVLVIATANVGFTVSNALFTNLAQFGVSTDSGSFPGNQHMLVRMRGVVGEFIQTVTVHGLFSTAGGADEFFFVGWEGQGSFEVSNLQLTLIYFPTAYGTVVATAASSAGGTISSESAEIAVEPVQAQAVGPAGSQQGQAQVMADMEARIRKVEEQLRQSQKR